MLVHASSKLLFQGMRMFVLYMCTVCEATAYLSCSSAAPASASLRLRRLHVCHVGLMRLLMRVLN